MAKTPTYELDRGPIDRELLLRGWIWKDLGDAMDAIDKGVSPATLVKIAKHDINKLRNSTLDAVLEVLDLTRKDIVVPKPETVVKEPEEPKELPELVSLYDE